MNLLIDPEVCHKWPTSLHRTRHSKPPPLSTKVRPFLGTDGHPTRRAGHVGCGHQAGVVVLWHSWAEQERIIMAMVIVVVAAVVEVERK